jgi:hypothetical protein
VEKLRASRSVLDAAKQLEARGYVIRYGVYKTTDDFQLVAISIVRKADDLSAVRQSVVGCSESLYRNGVGIRVQFFLGKLLRSTTSRTIERTPNPRAHHQVLNHDYSVQTDQFRPGAGVSQARVRQCARELLDRGRPCARRVARQAGRALRVAR